jgi:hypothetical protein
MQVREEATTSPGFKSFRLKIRSGLALTRQQILTDVRDYTTIGDAVLLFHFLPCSCVRNRIDKIARACVKNRDGGECVPDPDRGS